MATREDKMAAASFRAYSMEEEREAARAMLAAHERNASLDVDAIRNEGRLAEVLRAVINDARAVIAQAEAAGIVVQS